MALFVPFVLAAALAIQAAPAPPAPDLKTEVAAVADMLFTGKNDPSLCKPVEARLARIEADPGLKDLPSPFQRVALLMVLACAKADSPTALSAATRLAPIAQDRGEILAANWVLLRDGERRRDTKTFIGAVGRLIDVDASVFADTDPRAFGWATERARGDTALTADLLTHLRAVPWRDAAGRDAVDNGWAQSLARIAVEGGDKTKALALLDRTTDPLALLDVAQDRRFEKIWPEMEAAGRFDWLKVQTIDLERWREARRRQPELLINVTSEIDALRALGRYDEALALGEDHVRRLKAGETFEDADDQRSWMLNSHAYTLSALGRYEDADRIMIEAEGKDTVSQRINRAELLIDAGQAARALKVLESVKEKQSSPFGLMWRDAGLACAKAQLGDLAAARAMARSMVARWKDNGGAVTKAQVCAELLDEAAALYVQRLDDPVTRGVALEAFRTARPPPSESAYEKTFHARLESVQARPEVQAAVARWGRVLTVPLAGTYWGRI